MSLDVIFDSATQLPTVPKLVQDLIASFNDSNVKMDEIAKKISMGPVLTAKLLRIANSAHYGGGRRIGSVNDAVVLLGINSLKTLVLASGITGAFSYPASFDKNQFWNSSFERASICKWLAKYTSLDRETAFTCGMLSDIGTIMMVTTYPEQMGDILKAAAKGADRPALEMSSIGITAQEVSAELANRWHFPSEIVTALHWQNNPTQSGDCQLAYLLNLSNYLQHNRGIWTSEQLCKNFPLDIAEGAGLNAAKALAEIDELLEMESDFDVMAD